MKPLFIIISAAMIAISCGNAKQVVNQNGTMEYGEVDDVTISYGGTAIDANGYAVKKLTTENDKTVSSYRTITEYLQGKVPGLQIKEIAGGEPQITIRGVSSNTGNTSPLYIVDGMQVSSLTSIDPNNIYSVEVLKDASASLYGLQGANGVLIFTTKGAHMAEEQMAAERAAAKAAAKEARKAKKNK